MSKALVLFSGGVDSTFCLFHAKKHFDEVKTITFYYGQRHAAEVQAAQAILTQVNGGYPPLTHLGLYHKNCPLMDASLPMEVFENYEEAQQRLKGQIEPAFIPMRNSIFLDMAVNRAIVDDCYDIYIGVSKEDGDTVPDCTYTFLSSYQTLANVALGTAKKSKDQHIAIHAPLLTLGKVNGIREAFNYPGCYAAFAFSHTSYFGEYPPRARDHASVCREWAFAKAGVPDPLVVRAYLEGKMPLPKTSIYKAMEWNNYLADIDYPYDEVTLPIMWEVMLRFENNVKRDLAR